MQRRKFIHGTALVSSATLLPTAAVAKSETYEIKDTEKELDRIGTQIEFHDSQDRAAFISAAFEDGIELYVAEDVYDESDVPSQIYQITTDTAGGVYDPKWKSGNYLSFQKNLSRYTIQLPRSYKVLEHKLEEKNVVDAEETLANAEVVK